MKNDNEMPCGYVPPCLDAKDTDLLRDLITSARQIEIYGYGPRARSAMAALIAGVLGLGVEYQNALYRAIDGDEFRVSVTSEVII